MIIPTSSASSVKRALVLGGAGFLGTHLVRALLASGVQVRSFERRKRDSAPDVASSLDVPLRVTPDDPRLEIVTGNFSTGEGIAKALEGVDLVYHLVSTTVPSTSNADPVADVEGNLLGALRLLNAMRAADVGRIVYVSSGGTVYGNPSTLPVPENHPLEPLCSYGVVKVAVENYLGMYAHLYGLTANVLRVSNPYGTHQHRIGVQGVIPTFFKKIAERTPIEIWGDGSVVRDYLHVKDVVSALLLAGARDRSGTFNIGSGVGHSINEVLEIVQRQTGLAADVRYLPQRKFDVERIYLDISHARAELGWEPLLGLEVGCAEYERALRLSGRAESSGGAR
ncbi:NAD-dependent epimerase/dehydratase [Caballeronia terrestris]|uniref:UDP-glucose 4-epimerase n=1 Tax=Caballeronia terrestris TaxID=1226301 RepID=A0A158F773_9BURK|nr:NAD-dependent epimerase/dehydratase family protein [Caballeronia terrestris]SAL15726.1 NAD-dependent epimerase/dehydratase [Caballeronia terrestris]